MLPTEVKDFRQTRERTLEMVEGLSEERMQRRPSSDAWSPALLLEHLLLAEQQLRSEIEELVRLEREGRRPYLNRVISDLPAELLDFVPRPLLPFLEAPLTFGSAFVPRSAVEFALRRPVVKAKAPKVIEPKGGKTGQELRARLAGSLERTEAIFSDNSDLDFGAMLYHSVLVGVRNAKELVGIIGSHEKRHQDQLRTILDDLERT